jgi:hypothetical protein
MLINLPQQKAAPSCYPIPGSSPSLALFFLTVAGGERGELGRRSPIASLAL